MVTERGPYINSGYELALGDWIRVGTRHNQFGKKTTPDSHTFFFNTLMKVQAKDADNVVSVESLLPIAASEKQNVSETSLVTYLRNIIKDLFDLGILTRVRKKPRPNVRAQYVYTVVPPSSYAEKKLAKLGAAINDKKIEGKSTPTRQKRKLAIQEKIRADSGLLNISSTNPNEPWSIVLLTQLMERCCRRSYQDTRDTIESTIHIAGEEVEVVAFTVTRNDAALGGKPGLVSDQDAQVMLAIMTLATQQVEKNFEKGLAPVNRLVIDVVELCNILGKASQGASRKSVVQSLRRIIYTTWTLKPDTMTEQAVLIEKKLGFKVSEMDFQLIRDVVVGVDTEDDDNSNENLDTPRWFTVSLNDFVWRNLIQGIDARLLHPGILKESNAFLQKLHAHLRLCTPPKGTITRTVGDLWSRFDSVLPLTRFGQRLKNALLEKANLAEDTKIPEDGINIDFYGYQIKVLPDPLSQRGRILLECSMDEEGHKILQRQDSKIKKLHESSNLLEFDQKM